MMFYAPFINHRTPPNSAESHTATAGNMSAGFRGTVIDRLSGSSELPRKASPEVVRLWHGTRWHRHTPAIEGLQCIL